DAARVAVGSALEVSQRRYEVGHLVVGDPLERLIARLGGTLALAAHLEGEDVVALRAQELTIRDTRPPVGAELQPEQDYALARLLRLEVARLQPQPVRRGQHNVFRPGHRLSER